MKMSSFLFVRPWALPRILNLSCGIPFPVGWWVGISHDGYDKRGIAHACTNRKDNIFMQRRLGQIFICILEWGKGLVKNQDPFPARAYTTLVVLVWVQGSSFGFSPLFGSEANF